MEAGRKADEVAREAGVSTHTIYAWKQKYGGLEVADFGMLYPEYRNQPIDDDFGLCYLVETEDVGRHHRPSNIWSAPHNFADVNAFRPH